MVARVVHLADTEGLDTLADLWSGSPADSLAGCLWRLYLLRSWVYADPAAAAREFDAGRAHTPVHEVVAGVVDPPGPDEVRRLTDLVLRGVVRGDFADTLFRAAAFARVVAAGRAHVGASHASTPYDSDLSASRLLTLAEQLEQAARLELDGPAGLTLPRRFRATAGPRLVRLVDAPGRGSPGSQNKPLRAATRREALPVRRTTLSRDVRAAIPAASPAFASTSATFAARLAPSVARGTSRAGTA